MAESTAPGTGADADAFDPYTQSIILLGADGVQRYNVSLADVDAWNRTASSTCINYGAQIGASIVMLLMLLTLTPGHKLRRPTALVHVVHLVVNVVRMVLLAVYYTGAWVAFYPFFSLDFSAVPRRFTDQTLAANAFSALVVVVMQVALSMQAWAMVKIWPRGWKWAATLLSLVVSLGAVVLRLVYTVLIEEAMVDLRESFDLTRIASANAIYTALVIAFFCALFNGPLVWHLVKHRGLLHKKGGLTPMEVLVATNGILMIVPRTFSLFH